VQKKIWPLECKDFSKNQPMELHFDPTPSMFKLDRDITKANILSFNNKIGPKVWTLECKQDFF